MPNPKKQAKFAKSACNKSREIYFLAPDARSDVSPLYDSFKLDVSSWACEPPPRSRVPVKAPEFRPLKIYAIDSSRGRTPGNIITLSVKYEKLLPGPVGERIRVIDYDYSRDCFYDPVDLDDHLISMQEGVAPSESDPHFHQQMVYAVASETLRRFEVALGRTVRSRRVNEAAPFVLRIYPHAIRQPNAFASPDSNSLVFGYFAAGEKATGRIVPGQTVFTCLMHDAIAHTTTHGITAALRPDHMRHYMSGDCAAFMEGFADACALLLHYSHRDALLDTIQRTGGLIYKSVIRPDAEQIADAAQIQEELRENNPFITIAPSFGEAMGQGKGLRSALSKADPAAIEKLTKPHERGQILLAAIFDAFFSIYVHRSQDLFRIYRAGGGNVDGIDLPYVMAQSLADEANQIATRVFNLCVRALDYCPPVGLQFGDFLRACVTADHQCDPVDGSGVRESLIQAFRGRGIRPRGTTFFSEDGLRWPIFDTSSLSAPGPKFTGLPEPDLVSQQCNLSSVRSFIQANAEALGLRPSVDFMLFPLEISNWAAPGEPPSTIVTTQVLQTRGRRQKRNIETDQSAPPDETGIALVFECTGELRHVIRGD
jgi:hypothetical protein